jgi:hypothetical protein
LETAYWSFIDRNGETFFEIDNGVWKRE